MCEVWYTIPRGHKLGKTTTGGKIALGVTMLCKDSLYIYENGFSSTLLIPNEIELRTTLHTY